MNCKKKKCGCFIQCVEVILDTDNYYCEDKEIKKFVKPQIKKKV